MTTQTHPKWPMNELTRTERNAIYRVAVIGSGDSHSIAVRKALAIEMVAQWRARERAKINQIEAGEGPLARAFAVEAKASRQALRSLRVVARETR